MDAEEEARNHLINLMDGTQAHVAFEEVVNNTIPFGLRGIMPEKMPYSIWHLVEHIRLAQHDLLEYSKDSFFQSPPWPEGYWPESKSPIDEEEWNNSLETIKKDFQEMQELIKTQPLFEPFVNGSGHTLFRQAMLMAEHRTYHTGQLITLRRMLGIW